MNWDTVVLGLAGIGAVIVLAGVIGLIAGAAEWFGKVNYAVAQVETLIALDVTGSVRDHERRFTALDEYVDTSKYAFPVSYQQTKRWRKALEPINQQIDTLKAVAYDAKAVAESARVKAQAAADADEDTYDTLQQHQRDGHPKK